MNRCLVALLSIVLLWNCHSGVQAADAKEGSQKSLKIMLITGGCCHDYDFQTEKLIEAFENAKVKVDWKVVNEGGKGTKAQIDLYDDPEWSKGYDVVIHNECFANTKSEEYIRKITKAHQNGTNAVVIHCAMHTYRASKIDDWREFLGVTSRKHDHQSNYPVKVILPDHPVMKGFPKDWVSPKDELYIIETLWPNAKALAVGKREGGDQSEHACFWVNEYGKSRVFGTTFGHSNETFEDAAFVQAVVRGSLWAAGKLK